MVGIRTITELMGRKKTRVSFRGKRHLIFRRHVCIEDQRLEKFKLEGFYLRL
jgi:hypothetical protein